MKKLLVMSALAFTVMGNASAADFIAKELDGRLIQLENNANAGSCLNVTGDWVTTSPEKTNLSHTAWYAEYDATEDGVILSHNGKYIGCMPVVTDNGFDGKHIAAVSDKDQAGRYRLYPFEVDGKNAFCITCTRDTDGNLIETIGQGGAFGNVTGWWIQDGGTGDATQVNRWGSNPATSKWNYSFVDEVQITVDKSTGTLYNNGTNATETGWAKLWKSDKNPGTNPIVHIDCPNNNMKLIGDAVGLAPGSGCNYTFSCEDAMYYVAKVEFDFTSTDHTTTITANDQTMTTSGDLQHFELNCNYGEVPSFHMGGGNTAMTTSNFIITLRKLSKKHYVASLIDSTYGAYAYHPEIWDAELVNQAIAALEPQLDAALSTYVTSEEVTDATNICTANLSEYKKQIDETADGKTVTLRNLLHDTRYMSTAYANDTYTGGGVAGGLRAHTTDNPDDLNAVWTLIFDKETGAFRLQNYLNEREIGHTTQTEVPVVMAEVGEDGQSIGHLYEIKPMHYKDASHDAYTVAFWDRTGTGTGNSRTYLHCGSASFTGSNPQMAEDGNRVVKWSSAVNDAAASAWYINLVEIVNQMDALKSLEGKEVVIAEIDNGTYLSVADNAITHSTSLRPAGVWNIQVNTKNGRLTLKNLLSQTYANDLTSPLSATANSTIKVDDVESMLDTWHIIPTTATPTEEDAKYSIKEISDEQKEAMIAELHTLYGAWSIGNEPGLSVFETEADNATFAQTVEAIDSFNDEDGFDYIAANDAFTFVETKSPVLFDLNSLEGPALIQMAYTPNSVNGYKGQFGGDNQVSDQNISNILAFSTEASTFVLSDGKLHSLETGHGVVLNDDNHPKMFDGEEWSENITNAIDFTFVENSPKTNLSTSPDGVARKCYSVARTDESNWAFGGSTVGSNHLVKSHNVVQTAAVAYTIWYVKNLAVEVEEGGYKLWRTPVAVNFGGDDNNGAYVVSVKDTQITTTAANGDDTYGAGTMFILTKTVNLNVENGVAVNDVPTAGLGHHAKQVHTMTPGNVYLTIHPDQTVAPAHEDEAYSDVTYFDGEPQNTVKMYVEIPTEETTRVLGAHEAIIEAKQSTQESTLTHGGAMTLALGGSNDTTQIGEISAEKVSADGVYDLQGRKLAAPVKGINIVNGKKVLVK